MICENDALCHGGDPENTPCVVLYSECNFEGHSVRICEDTPFADFDFEV